MDPQRILFSIGACWDGDVRCVAGLAPHGQILANPNEDAAAAATPQNTHQDSTMNCIAQCPENAKNYERGHELEPHVRKPSATRA